MLVRWGEKGALIHCWYKENNEVSKKIKKNWTATLSSNTTSEYTSERNENGNLKRYLSLQVHRTIIHNNQDMETTHVSINRWLDKKKSEILYTIYNEILFGYEKRKFCYFWQYEWIFKVLC